MRASKKGKIGILVPLLFLLLLSFSCSSNKIDQNYCYRLSEIKTMPLKGEPVEDDVYNGLMKMGDLAVPCLIDQLTSVTRAPDPRQTPIYSETTLGDVALFALLDITKVAVEDVFPKGNYYLVSNLSLIFVQDSGTNPARVAFPYLAVTPF